MSISENNHNRPLFEAEFLEYQADSRCAKEEWQEADSLLDAALAKRKEAVGADDPSVAALLDKLAGVCVQRGDSRKAQQLLAQAENILETAYYPAHGALGPILEHHADCLIADKKYTDAEPLMKRAHEIYAKTVTMENRDTIRAAYKLATLYLQMSRAEEAAALLEKMMKHVETPLGPSAEFRYVLALAYLKQGKNDEALNAEQQAISVFKQRRNYSRVADCLDLHAQLLRGAGDKGNAAVLHLQAEMYRKLAHETPYTKDIFLATLLRA